MSLPGSNSGWGLKCRLIDMNVFGIRSGAFLGYCFSFSISCTCDRVLWLAAAGGSRSATTTAGHRRPITSPRASFTPRRWCARRCLRWCPWSWWSAPAGYLTSTPTARAARSEPTNKTSTCASTAWINRPGKVPGTWLVGVCVGWKKTA